MTPQMQTVQRYGLINRKPFTAHDFISCSGLAREAALSALQEADSAGIVALVQPADDPLQSVYVPRPVQFLRRSYWDFTPRKDKLQAILNFFTPRGVCYDTASLRFATGIPRRTLQRYLLMLAHLGCLKIAVYPTSRGKSKYIYSSTGSPIPDKIPPFYAKCAGLSRGCSPAHPFTSSPVHPKELT